MDIFLLQMDIRLTASCKICPFWMIWIQIPSSIFSTSLFSKTYNKKMKSSKTFQLYNFFSWWKFIRSKSLKKTGTHKSLLLCLNLEVHVVVILHCILFFHISVRAKSSSLGIVIIEKNYFLSILTYTVHMIPP